MKTKTLLLTLGDPAGVGPEVVLKSLAVLKQEGISFKVIGPPNLKQNFKGYEDVYLSTETPFTENLGVATENSGVCAYEAIFMATTLCQNSDAYAMVTGPINKTALQLAGIPYSGHTSLLKDLAKSGPVSMAFYTEPLKVLLTTIHIPYQHVPSVLSVEKIKLAIKHSVQLLNQLGYERPRIAVAGLNPHAGEGGLFGTEEKTVIQPAIEASQVLEADITGPYPPDTVFHQAYHGHFDLVVAMTHDHGLIPIKLIQFDKAVNVTVGLPFIRTSPDHGTAYDIVGQNKASETSFLEACRLAVRLQHVSVLTR